MAPLPKRKHSTRRKGLRMNTRKTKLGYAVKCGSCGKLKISHRQCPYCRK